MRITTLGTSHGAPEKDRFCTSTLIEIGESGYLIDVGAPVEALLVNKDKKVSTIKGVFITHMHSDHANDLFALTKAWAVYHRDSKVSIFLSEERARTAYENWADVLHMPIPKDRISILTTHEGEIYKDENIKVTAIATGHISGAPTYAYLVEAEGKRVVFTGDLAGDFHDYPKLILQEECDLVVCELTHYPVEKAIPVLQMSKTKKIIFTHLFHFEDKIHKLDGQLPFQFEVANDGDEFII